MLQQTQVSTVIPYYYRWLERFPTLESVASASQTEVLKVWEGLGYYSRCRNFLKACQIVVKEYNGRIPSSWSEFRSLPGVGDYTAAAVLSFAFGKPYPVLDSNVNRVMARLLIYPHIAVKGKRVFLKQLKEWIDQEHPSEFNQAMMDLGSLVCCKNQPHCIDCPITQFCEGYHQGNPERFPLQPEGKPRPHKIIVAGVIWNKDKFLIQKRPSDGLLGGLWEFPGGKVKRGESPEKALIREVNEETGLEIDVQKPIGAINHAYTHFSITLHVFHCSVINRSRVNKFLFDRKWIDSGDLSDYPFPKANLKVFDILEEEGWNF